MCLLTEPHVPEDVCGNKGSVLAMQTFAPVLGKFLLTCAVFGGRMCSIYSQRDDENQYISKGTARELPVGARQRAPGCGIPFGAALLKEK